MQSPASLSSWGCCCTGLQATNHWIWLHHADRYVLRHRQDFDDQSARRPYREEYRERPSRPDQNKPGADGLHVRPEVQCAWTGYGTVYALLFSARHSLSNHFLISLYSAHSPTDVSGLLFVSTLNLHFAANSNGFQKDHLCARGCGCCHLCCAQTLWRSLSSIHCLPTADFG